MDGHLLRTKIIGWNLSQAEFARWLGVSPGAVAQWLAATRSIPGPVIAFIKLFESLPTSLQTMHLSQIKQENKNMEGMYMIDFHGSGGAEGATLTFKGGNVYGFDIGGGVYDGYYRSGQTQGMTDIEVTVKMPAGLPSVIRNIVQPFDWNLIARTSVPTGSSEAKVYVETNLGEAVIATFKRMRNLPLAA